MKKPFVIALTGTPGTGKSKVARMLKKKGFAIIDLNRVIRMRKLYSRYDKKRKTYVANMKKSEKFLRMELKSGKHKNKTIIVDSHLSHLLPANLIDIVIVLRCDPEELEKRLKKKGWNAEKIRENAEAEIIGLIEYEARKKHGKVFAIDSTKLKPEQVAEKVIRAMKPI